MNPNNKIKEYGPDITTFVTTIVLICFVVLCFLVLNPLHKKNIEKLSQPPLIVCYQCKGSGEYPTDINKLMMEASLTLFINKHLMVDRCEKCVKLPYGEGYDYCDKINDRYQTLLKEYAAAGPKIDITACNKCMGMGTFSSKDLSTGKWQTQEDYDNKHKLK